MDTSQQAAVVLKDRDSLVALKRQRRSIAEKRRIVEETLVEGASVARVARAHGINANQVFYWRKLYQTGRLGTTSSARLLPVRLSNSIVTLPIYDDTVGPFTVDQPSVTIVGFLQVFISGIDTTTGNINVTVLNVAGCSNTATDSTPTVSGTSPVPIRLITQQ